MNESTRSRRNRELAALQEQAVRAPAPVFYASPAPAPAAPYVTAQVLHDRNASVVNVQVAKRTGENYHQPVYEYKASGSAKREQGDVHDELTGELIALARAFENLSRQLMSEAGRRVKASAKAEGERRERIAAKRERALAPVARRTREEWEEIQARSREAQNEVLARYLGLAAPGIFGALASVARVMFPDGQEPGPHRKA